MTKSFKDLLGAEEVNIEDSSFFGISRVVDSVQNGNLAVYLGNVLSSGYLANGAIEKRFYKLCPQLAKTPADRIFCLDLELPGFSYNDSIIIWSMANLNSENQFQVETALARDFSEESGVLMHLLDKLRQIKAGGDYTILTWKGSFDNSRANRRLYPNRVRIPETEDDFIRFVGRENHVDLHGLVKQEKLWDLQDGRLQTVERTLLGCIRGGDISGKGVARIYQGWVNGLYSYYAREDGQNRIKAKPHLVTERIDDETAEEGVLNLIAHNQNDVVSPLAILGFMCSPNGKKKDEKMRELDRIEREKRKKHKKKRSN